MFDPWMVFVSPWGMRWLLARLRVICVASLLMLLIAQPVGAQRMKLAMPAGKSGFSIYLEGAPSVGKVGYGCVRVTIEQNPFVPAAADDRFVIRLKDQYGPGGGVTGTSVLSAGQTATTCELIVPCHNNQNSWFHIRIDSQRYGLITNEYSELGQSQVKQSNTNLMPSALVIRSAFSSPTARGWSVAKNGNRHTGGSLTIELSEESEQDDMRVPSLHLAQSAFEESGESFTHCSTAFEAINRLEHVQGCRPVDLPATWVGMSSVDQVYVSLDTLRAISGNQRQRTVLRRWVAAGGTLVVIPSTPTQQPYAHAENVVPLLLGEEYAEMLKTPFDQWRKPSTELLELQEIIVDPTLIGSSWEQQNYTSTASFVTPGDFDREALRLQPVSIADANEERSPFLIQRFANGCVVALGSTAHDWEKDQWRLFYNSLQVAGLSLQEHLGSGNQRSYRDGFWIEGVGDPPVRAFQILIALFMIVAGPVMVILLKRTQRMQLLFVAVPALSLAACSGLLAYAVLSDGFVTLGRARTFTRIDARTGDAMTHARAAYYSGTQPAASQVALDTVIIQNTEHQGTSGGQIDQFSDGYRYSGGRIRARSPHQLITLRSHVTRCGIMKIAPDSGEGRGGTPMVEFANRLETTAAVVVIRTADGYFVAENVSDGRAQATSVKSTVAGAKVAAAFKERSSYVDSYMNRSGRPSWQYNNQMTPEFLGDEDRVSQQIMRSDLDLLMPVGSWLAVCDAFPTAMVQLNDVKFSQQCHIIMGDWSP